MALNPIPFLALAVILLTFEFMISGDELVVESFPGGFEVGGLDILGDIIDIVVDGFAFLFNSITANVDEAPWYFRVPFGTIVGGAIFLFILQMIRGN